MFEKKTVFVVGAGASKELGFPLGAELRDEIRALMKNDDRGPQFYGPGLQFINEIARGQDANIKNEYYTASKALYDNLSYFNSIDEFLFQRQSQHRVVELGKLAIAKLILEKERNSALTTIDKYHRLTDSNLKSTWLFAFVKMLVRGCPLKDVDSLFKNVSFISFNYDRSLERFLTIAISEVCEISPEEAVKIISETVYIHHIYGSLGLLPGFAKKRTHHSIWSAISRWRSRFDSGRHQNLYGERGRRSSATAGTV